MYSIPMRMFPCLSVALVALPLLLAWGCADPITVGAGGAGGSGGRSGSGGSIDGGIGGMGGAGGAAGTNCIETGCSDGNACTVDGVCNTVMGVCMGGGGFEPADTPCTQEGGFFCDGEGTCVVCNEDVQCARFFPPRECRDAAVCVDKQCPFPDALPDGSPCSEGQCYQGGCVPVAPQNKLVPMVCDNQVTPFFWEIPMNMTVAPSAIEATRPFTAQIEAALSIPQEFLQFGLVSVFPAALTDIEITSAAAEIVTSGVLSGSPVSTVLAPVPVTAPIPQVPNPGNPGGDACTTDEDCPLAAFGQRCGADDECACACETGCVPEQCANVVTGDIEVPVNRIFNAPYRAEAAGAACFDVGGEDPPSAIGAPPLRTGIRGVASNGAFIRFECVGGTANDNGTPRDPFDDFVDPNPPAAQICFPIDTPDVDLCEVPPPVDCSDDNECAVDGICDPFTGECSPGNSEPRGTPCDQDGGRACDGQGNCVQCVEDMGCADDGNQCTSDPVCANDTCLPLSNLPEGTVCNQDGGNLCDGSGNCILVGDGPLPQSQELTLGCTSNLTSDVALVPFQLSVAPSVIVQGDPFTADLSGVGLISEDLLDSVQWVIVGGATRVDLIDLLATVHVRAGATGDDVSLSVMPIPYRCAVDGAICDPSNDEPSIPGRRSNSDCAPVGPTNPCGRFLVIPTSDDCAPGGICAQLDGGAATKVNQCATNGFCVTEALPIPLESQVGSYVAGAAGQVLFGWDDANTGATLDANGTWDLLPAVFDDPIASNGVRASIDGLSVALECTMGVDSDGIFGVGVPDQSSPSPNLSLISFPIRLP